MKAGDVFVRFAQLKLVNDVVAHALRGAGGECGDGTVGKMDSQAAQLAVFGAKLVSPFRNAMRFVDGEKRDRHALQPIERVRARQALRRKIQQAVLARARFANHLGLLAAAERTVQQRRRNSHLIELRHLILHQRDQRRNDDDGLLRQHRARQLVAQRFPAAGWHHDASIAAASRLRTMRSCKGRNAS